jgi:hypothetical protein
MPVNADPDLLMHCMTTTVERETVLEEPPVRGPEDWCHWASDESYRAGKMICGFRIPEGATMCEPEPPSLGNCSTCGKPSCPDCVAIAR